MPSSIKEQNILAFGSGRRASYQAYKMQEGLILTCLHFFNLFTFFEIDTNEAVRLKPAGLRILNRADFSFEELYQQR
jgi:hypothetical protein